ncbi:hypothetical protein D3C81_489860 [compost metagenome]
MPRVFARANAVGLAAVARVKNVAAVVIGNQDVTGQQQVVVAVVYDRDSRRALGGHRARATDVVALQDDVTTSSVEIADAPGIERLARRLIEIVDACCIQLRLQLRTVPARTIKIQHITAATALAQRAIGIDDDVQYVVATGNNGAVNDDITDRGAGCLAVTHGDRNEAQVVAGCGAFRVAEYVVAV